METFSSTAIPLYLLHYKDGIELISNLSATEGYKQFGATPRLFGNTPRLIEESPLQKESPATFFCTAFPHDTLTEHQLLDKSRLQETIKRFKNKLVAGILPYEFGYSLEASLAFLNKNICQLDNKNRKLTPSIYVGVYDWWITYDQHSNHFAIYSVRECTEEQFKQWLSRELSQTPQSTQEQPPFRLKSTFTQDQPIDLYLNAVKQIQHHISNGDCYQVNFTQRFSSSYSGNTWQAFNQLSSHKHGKYSAYINCGELQVLSFSPEQFFQIKDNQVITKPIKGTRPRGETAQEDIQQQKSLTDSLKDRAENLMIVDLLRNDLGKICEIGSVEVEKLFDIESFSNVHHLVSTIKGTLRNNISPLEALLSMFPGGSITGAPKIKSMEIIKKLENFSRDVYCGSIFYITPNGDLNSSITIRTLSCENGKIHAYGGGGIVSDSNPKEEYLESVNKIKLFMDELEQAFLTL